MAIINGGINPDDLFGDENGVAEADTINGFAGDDYIEGFGGNDTINAGDDNDLAYGGQGDDIVNGDDGNDVLGGDGGSNYAGPSGDDTLNGGLGDDILRGGAGVDTFHGGDGYDRISFYTAAALNGVVASLMTGTISDDGYGNLETFTSIEALGAGTAFVDTLEGDDNANFIGGGTGDILTGHDGDDEFQLDGAANVDGGDGVDTILSFVQQSSGSLVPDGADANTLADIIFAEEGVEIYLWDNIIADDGFGNTSTIVDVENVGGSSLNDYIEADAVNNHLWGFEGDDELYAFGGNDTLEGGDGSDVLFGDGWNNWQGASGDDTLDGGAGDDFLRGGDGVDTYIGGDGVDRISFYMFAATEGVVANLSTGQIENDGYGNAELIPNDIEGLGNGTRFVDTFTGNNNGNAILGGTGDFLYGLGGADFFGLQGAVNTVDGGDGVDWIDYCDSSRLVDANSDGFAEEEFSTNGWTVNLLTGSITDGFGVTGSVVNIENAYGSDYNDIITGDGGTNDLSGGLGDDTLNGGTGDDYLEAYAGLDTLNGGDGRDLVYFNMQRVTQGIHINLLTQTVVNDGYGGTETLSSIEYFQGYAGDWADTIFADTFIGDDNDNEMAGSDGDTLVGNGGTDYFHIEGLDGGSINGGAGYDQAFFYDVQHDRFDNSTGMATTGVIVNLTSGQILNDGFGGAGTITAIENVTTQYFNDTVTGNGAANILTAGQGNDTLYGMGGVDTLNGGDDNDTLDGGAAADNLNGGDGDDAYIIDATDILTDTAGVDEVRAGFSYTLRAGFENLTLTGTGAFNATGNGAANILTGNSGANILDGKSGLDTMIGGAGDDTYYVNIAGDVTTETNAAHGVDLVISSVTRTLGAFLENLTLDGVAVINGSGNTLNNVITGNGAANVLQGLGGADTLNGGAGADTLDGGAGNDIYIIDASDTLVDATGVDEVRTTFSYTLLTGFENLTLLGSASVNATGNGSANILIGNSGANILDGKTGVDTMSGGLGNDTYVVDLAGDTVIEAANGGIDTVRASVTYTLGANQEHLALIGGAIPINGTGNTLDNTITGNGGANVLRGMDGADVLDGGLGADTMEGGAGNDSYYVNTGSDVTTEAANAGLDTVYSSVSRTLGANFENLTLLDAGGAINGTGNTAANLIIGNNAANVLNGGDGADTLRGGDGADTLNGGVGQDVLRGDGGSDIFVFNVAATVANRDTIQNYDVAADTIHLENAIFTQLAAGNLTAAAFWRGAAAHDGNDRIIYNPATGALIYDSNGNAAGGAAQIATLATNLSITQADFFVI